jgi:hypothetical protein
MGLHDTQRSGDSVQDTLSYFSFTFRPLYPGATRNESLLSLLGVMIATPKPFDEDGKIFITRNPKRIPFITVNKYC